MFSFSPPFCHTKCKQGRTLSSFPSQTPGYGQGPNGHDMHVIMAAHRRSVSWRMTSSVQKVVGTTCKMNVFIRRLCYVMRGRQARGPAIMKRAPEDPRTHPSSSVPTLAADLQRRASAGPRWAQFPVRSCRCHGWTPPGRQAHPGPRSLPGTRWSRSGSS